MEQSEAPGQRSRNIEYGSCSAQGLTPSPALGFCEGLPLFVPSFLPQMKPVWAGTLPPFPAMSCSQKPDRQELDHGGLLTGSGDCRIYRALAGHCRPTRQLACAEVKDMILLHQGLLWVEYSSRLRLCKQVIVQTHPRV